MSAIAQYAPMNGAWTDPKTGKLTASGQIWLRDLWLRVGGAEATDLGTVGADLDALEVVVAGDIADLAALEAIVTAMTNGHAIQDEGAALTQRATLDFVGGGVAATDTGTKTRVTIKGVISGTSTVDFGSGASHASLAVTGQTLLTGGVQCWIKPEATADHSADEHLLETLKVFASDIVAGVGFTLHLLNSSEKNAPSGRGTLIRGRWSVGWSYT